MHIEIITIATILVIILAIIANYVNKPISKKRSYLYTKKSSVATHVEQIFYRRLKNALNDNYAIIPQAHLSSFLDEHTKGQNWKYAFNAINSKSVDFLICEKDNLRPLIAIELDDFTHNRKDRIERDEIVNNIMKNANIPLIRYTQGEWNTEEAILQKIEVSIAKPSPKQGL